MCTFFPLLSITDVKSAHFILDTIMKILKEEGKRKEVNLAFISLDNMDLNGKFNTIIFHTLLGIVREEGQQLKTLNINY